MYDWEKNSEGQQAARLPAGEHDVTIVRVLRETKEGALTSQGGDPQLLVVFADREAREATEKVTLSDKAAWTLARLMGACDPPINLARMRDDGIEPGHFADLRFASAQLLNRRVRVRVDWKTGDNGKPYADVTPLRSAHQAAPGDTAAPPSAPPTAPSSPPPPPPAPAAAPAGPPEPPPPPKTATKQQAWERWVRVYQKRPQTELEEYWFKAIAEIGKPETQFTPEDWGAVMVSADPVPF